MLSFLFIHTVENLFMKYNWSTPKHKPKHKLEKWFIISVDGVGPYVHTKQNKPIKELNVSLFKLVLWLVLGRGSLYDSSLVFI